MEHDHTVNIRQTQRGPLHLVVPRMLKLSQENVAGTRRLNKEPISKLFKGSLQIVNAANQLVSFKVHSVGVEDVTVRPSVGIIDFKETTTLMVTAKNSSSGLQGARFGIVILATTCECNDTCNSNDLHSFWNEISRDESKSFIDVFLIKQFTFTDVRGFSESVNYDEGDETETSCNSESFNEVERYFSADHGSSIFDPVPDSDGSGDNFQQKNKRFRGIIKELQKSDNLNARNWARFRRNLFLFLVIMILFFAVQTLITSVEFNILHRL